MKKLMMLIGFIFMGMSIQAQSAARYDRCGVYASNKGKVQSYAVSNNYISPREKKNISKKRVALDRAIRLARADGRITRREQANIDQKRRALNQRIRKAQLH